MNVAWVAHHNTRSPQGGAEMTDREMIDHAPAGVEVEVVHPRNWRSLRQFDRVVVSRLEQMPFDGAGAIAATRPIFFSHGDVLPRSHAVKHVVQASRPFIAQSPLSKEHIDRWAGIQGIAMVPYMSLDGIRVADKEEFALWPHRSVGHKGLELARRWADKWGIELVVCTGRPRSEVLDLMSRARWVVLLSKILDGCPRAIREAQLSECEIIVNELVGWWDMSPEELRAQTLAAPEKFWSLL